MTFPPPGRAPFVERSPASMCPLLGRWQIDRRVHDFRRAQTARFTGEALIGPEPPSEGEGCGALGAEVLVWREAGELVSAAHRGPAGRTLLIVADGVGWQVQFADGRPFHRLDLANGACTVMHACSPDRYDGAFTLHTADHLSVVWRVDGPRKSLEIISDYRRDPDG